MRTAITIAIGFALVGLALALQAEIIELQSQIHNLTK